MAKINGLELKAVTKFKGHDGEPLTQGNIYLKGKKIGYYSDDSWGGQTNIDIDKEYKEEFYSIVDSYMGKKESFMADEIFISDLAELLESEKEFKKAIKKGYKAIVLVSHPEKYTFQITSPNASIDDTIDWLDKNGYEKYKINGKYQLEMFSELSQFDKQF